MSMSSRKLSARAVRHVVFQNTLMPIVIVVIAWGLHVSDAVFGFDLLGFFKGNRNSLPEPFRHQMTWWIAVIGTLGAIGTAGFYVHRAWRLARYGVEVQAEVRNVGRIVMKGLVRVDYQYSCNGRHIRKSMSCLREIADEYRDGSRPLIIVCDPAKPARSLERSDVFVDDESV